MLVCPDLYFIERAHLFNAETVDKLPQCVHEMSHLKENNWET